MSRIRTRGRVPAAVAAAVAAATAIALGAGGAGPAAAATTQKAQQTQHARATQHAAGNPAVGHAAQVIGHAGDVAARVRATSALLGEAPAPQSARSALVRMRAASSKQATTATATALPKDTLAYGVPTLWNAGITGQGSTVALIESFGDPQAQAYADSYSAKYGLPRANVETITPAGPLPSCTGSLKDACDDWVGETDLDVAMVHAMAPQATIMIVATPVEETEGFQGLPEMMVGINYVVDHRLADVISMSLGTTEENFPTLQSIKTLLPAFDNAARHGIPISNSSGDDGAASETNSSTGPDVYPFRAVSVPTDIPSVIGVGGTVVKLDASGKRTKPDSLIYFSGSGFSKVFKRPAYQNSVKNITKSAYKSITSITMDGAEGTSQSAPLFAGILALTKQKLGSRPLGDVQSVLYKTLGPAGAKDGVVDVTTGNNSYEGVPGFTATKAFDVASGWGTVNAPLFVPALAKALRAQH